MVPIKYSYLLSKTLVSKDCLIMLQNNGDHSLSSKDDLKRIGRALMEIIYIIINQLFSNTLLVKG